MKLHWIAIAGLALATPCFANNSSDVLRDAEICASPLRLAQATAPGRPLTPAEQQQPAPNPPNRDPIAPREPPPPPPQTKK